VARFAHGQQIELREFWAGRAWEVRPAIVVQDTPELIALYTPPERPALTATDLTGARIRLPLGEWTLSPVKTFEFPVLGLHVPGTEHSLLLIWEPDWQLRHWYINLESDLRRASDGFEYEDHVLDVVASPDLSSWWWKDEDELEEAVSQGLINQAHAERFRTEGEHAVEWLLSRRQPYDRDWESWRPPDSWTK